MPIILSCFAKGRKIHLIFLRIFDKEFNSKSQQRMLD